MNFVKKSGKNVLCWILEKQAVRLRKAHSFIVVAVAGSVGKTSTKLAIASVLESTYKVRYQTGNYNDRLTVPLVLFGHTNPSLFNLVAWLKIIVSNEKQIKRAFDYQAVVLELGTDGPGQIAEFAYVKPDIAIVTAATDEHMEYFKTIDAVAEEELSVLDFSKIGIVNTDDVPKRYLESNPNVKSYGLNDQADYRIKPANDTQDSSSMITFSGGSEAVILQLLGSQGAKVALAAFAAGVEAGVDPKVVAKSLGTLTAFSGRMRLLKGHMNSTIIDDTYNASPAAVTAALDVLYNTPATQRIAILGMMNELGDTSQQSHRAVGNYCRPEKLDLVVTIGADAKSYTAPAAEARGCKVQSFDSPYDAGEFVKSQLIEGAVILAKGSQNRVFAEEALKSLLLNKEDEKHLVRQSDYWLKIKRGQFGGKV